MKKKIFNIINILLIVFSLSGCYIFKESIEQREYDVSNDYFTYIDFSPSTIINHNLVNGKEDQTPVIKIYGKCSYDIFEIFINAKLYSETNDLIDTLDINETKEIKANEEFMLYGIVTSQTQVSTKKVVATFSGKSHYNPSKSATLIVTFVFNNDDNDLKTNVKSGKTVKKPNNPIKENYIFSNWCTDIELKKEYDFSQAVNSNITLYAKFNIDYATLTNKITSQIMKANVTIYTKSYNTFLGIETSSETKSGSGIIFYEHSKGYYYLLTNNHVATKNKEYEIVSYTVEDYLGNKYNATLQHKEASYDLAVLYFKKGIELNIIERTHTNTKIDEEIVSLGQPKGQTNAISYGKVLSYQKAPNLSETEKYMSDVQFNVLLHNANTASGSSGGAILNIDLQLVGVHYAGATNATGDFVHGYAIPIEKIKEFLDLYVWTK